MRLAQWAALVLLLSSCSRPPAPVVITLTAPAPTATVAPVDLSAPMQVGSMHAYTDGTTLVAVPSGPFKMGHGTADNPEHTVTLSDYWIYSTKVTNAQYALCVAQERCTAPDPADNPDYSAFGSRNNPVVGVTYDQAQSYCGYMNGSLPTEAQWEKAARGLDAPLYPWGKSDPSCELLNFNNCVKHTTDVTQYAKGKSYYGALDMEGNAYEWIADWYDPLYYKASPPGDPPGPADGRARVQRGSSYRSKPGEVVAYARLFGSPNTHRGDLGFRCVVSAPTYFAPSCQLAPVVGEAQLSTLTVDCPKISIDVQTRACRYGGGAIVTFNDDHPQDPNASFGGIVGCSLTSGAPGMYPLTYACKQGGTAVLSTSCTYAGIQNGTCPAHYTFDSVTGTCKWDNNRTASIECATGYFFNPISHCCAVETGKLADSPVCPVGLVFTETGAGQYSCLPGSSAVAMPLVQAAINPPDCPGLCNLSIELCAQRNLVFCANTCACLSVGVKCPTH
jgi:formylglycine-generating enzyme required for sulfatase activity